jgi:protoheme IX farnesyltransferase
MNGWIDYLPLFKLRIGAFITLAAMVGAVAAAGQIPRTSLLLFLGLSVLLASSSAAVFNHYFDRDLDARMERTRGRPLPSGRITDLRRVLGIGWALLLLALGIALAAFHPLVALHLALGAFVYAVVYTVWLKRRHWLNIVIGGLAGSFAVLAGGAAVRPEFCLPPILLALVLFFWTPSHFWSLAMAFREEYARAGVPMLPVLAGNARAALDILINSLLLVGASLLPWVLGVQGGVYLGGAILAGGVFLYQNLRLLRDPSPRQALRNFKGSMIYLSVLFLAVLLDVVWAQ